jgi:hypothetical protein
MFLEDLWYFLEYTNVLSQKNFDEVVSYVNEQVLL